ncbi:MAG: autotransporter domain-containing protein, partial [Pseudomonadota bacterium]
GASEDAVVDGSLKVHGVDGLRVADSSIMPSVPTGNINAQVGQQVALSVGNLAASATVAASAGATQIVMPNLPSLGATPNFNTNPSTAAVGGIISGAHNTAIAGAAAQVAEATGATVFVVDFATLGDDAIANPGKYGLTNVTQACIDTACVLSPAEVQDSFLFWDAVHPTRAAHALQAAFFADTLIAPRTLAAQAETGHTAGEGFGRRLSEMAALGALDQDVTPFIEASYLSADRDTEPFAIGYETTGGRISLGFAKGFADGWSAGMAAAFDLGETDLEGGLGGFDYWAARFGGFVGLKQGPLSIGSSISVGLDRYNSIDRNTGVVGQVASGETDGRTLAFTAEGSYAIGADNASIAPVVRFAYVNTSVDGYRESGATGLDQVVGRRSLETATAAFGARLQAAVDIGDAVLKPRLAGFYEVDFDDSSQAITTALVTVDNVERRFRTDGLDDEFVRIEGGVTVEVTQRYALDFYGDVVTSVDDGEGFAAGVRLISTF